MRIVDLPRDLVEEILSRIPLKSLRTLRLTCKNWDTLSKTQSFTKLRIGKEEEKAKEGESRMIVLLNYTLHLISVDVNNDPSTEPKGKLSCFGEQVKIVKVFHCEGLLLCMLEDDEFTLVAWNPYLGQTRWIKPRFFCRHPYAQGMYLYALGYENKKNKSRSYKILRFIDLRVSDFLWGDKTGVPKDTFSWYEIYDFDTGSWRTLDVTPHWWIEYYACSVSLNGNTYWRATYRNSDDGIVPHIICFDFTREIFGPLLPLPFTAYVYDRVSLSCVREEKLAALFQNRNTQTLDVWITTKIESKMMSWSKFLTMDIGVVNNSIKVWIGSFFFEEEKKVAMVFDELDRVCRYKAYIFGEDGYFQRLDFRKCTMIDCRPRMCSYIPSLVQIKQKRGKRKQQSKLENRRYEEKMQRIVEFEKRIKEVREA